ncbi:MAG: ATP-binding protein, partial [Deltaproteobacteria bacterium]|nr:ATP-binding protein [Deltaproteobacteria bacterium]
MSKSRNIIFIGPTGTGKTGLATAFLTHAIDKGYNGRFITFPELVEKLYNSVADHTETKVLKKFAAYDALLIDELGYVEVEPIQVGLFFTLMHKRHRKKTSLLTSNLLCGAPHKRFNAEFIVMRSSLSVSPANHLFRCILTLHKRTLRQRGDQFIGSFKPSGT